MNVDKWKIAKAYITRPKDKLSFNEKKKIVEDHYKYQPWANRRVERLEQPKSKPMSMPRYVSIMNRLYGSNGGSVSEDPEHGYVEPEEFEDIKKSLKVSPLVKKPKKKIDQTSKKNFSVAGIKDTALYKLLENPKVLGVELGHETILEIMNLINAAGIVKKPEKEEIDHIALLEKLARET